MVTRVRSCDAVARRACARLTPTPPALRAFILLCLFVESGKNSKFHKKSGRTAKNQDFLILSAKKKRKIRF